MKISVSWLSGCPAVLASFFLNQTDHLEVILEQSQVQDGDSQGRESM